MKNFLKRNRFKLVILFLCCSVFFNTIIFSQESTTEIINLINKLGDKDSLQATDELIKKGEQSLIPELFSGLNNRNVLVRKNTALVIEKIGKPAIAYLAQLLKDSKIDDSTKDFMITILGNIKDDASIAVLTDALLIDNPYLRINLIRILKSKGDQVLPFIEQQFSNNTNPNFRRSIPNILCNIKHPNSTKLLLQLLDDTDNETRKNVAYVIGKTNNPEFVPYLAKKILDKDEDIEIKRGYAISLKTIGTPEAFNALIEIFKQPGAMRPNCSCEHDKKPVVPVMTSPFAIFVKDEMLSTTANDSIVFLNNNLESILKIAGNNKENIQIRYLMLDIIDEMKNEKAVPFILESFRFDFKFRIMGIFAISHIGDKTIPYLIDFIKSEKSNAFTGSLGELFSKLKNYSSPITNLYVDGTPEIKEKVLKILLTAGNMDLLAQITVKANSDERLFIAKVISKQNADSYFINILQIKDSELSLIACDNLAQLKSERAINLCLLGLLNSEDKKLQAAAQNAIKAIASKFNADDYINTYLNENQQEVIQNLFVEILTEFGSDITPTLIKYIDHKDKVLKKKVLTVFLKIGADTAPELIKLISDKNKRAAAIDILKQMDQKIIPSLIQSLNSPDPMVIFAIKEIIVLRQADSNQYLIQNLNNENLPIQLACAELLAAQNLKNAIPTLIIFLSAENKAYQLRAVFALVKYQEAALDPLSIEWEKQNKDKGFFESILQIFKKDKSILKDKKLKLFNQNVNKVFYTIGAKALDNLIVMAKTYKDNELKIEIFKYLKTIKNEKISLLFIENLENIDPDIVIASCEGLAALKEEKGEQALKNIISKTKNEKIKQSAEFALRQINGSKK